MYDHHNLTRISEVLLLGFQNIHHLKILLFIIFFLIYIVTLSGNILIVWLVSVHHQLHNPMFLFLSLLSSSEVISTTNIVPKMLTILMKEGDFMPFSSCLAQFYIFSASTNSECFLLSVMSYDRYLAICNPLRYISIMDLKLQLKLVVWSCLTGLMVTLLITLLVNKLQFCGPSVIDHFFCDLAPLLELSCSDTTMVETQAFIFSVPVIVFPFIFIVATYVFISIAIIRITSSDTRQKAFSTCSSHLAVVFIYYGTLISVYLFPLRGHSPSVSKVLSLLYILVTPLFNPIIYSLKNQEIQTAIKKSIFRF
ncbi:olfactory receptor 11L1-like [Hyperolius riggenbachi]|uniref:olfactory receptor 11L1-like n=1 Tax=Hyperolius riggenbachi TaxID=752182 RepID=UPI0035A3650F